ncbi:MAG: FUSC family protein, partial [Bryobacteraceae bacterium]
LLALGGGFFQTLLAVLFWPLRRYAPERRALRDLYAELARAAAAPVRASEAPPASAQSTQAQNELTSLDRDRSIDGERYRLLLSQAERMRLSLLMLARLRSRLKDPAPAETEILERYFFAASGTLGSIADSLNGGEAAAAAPGELGELHALAEALREREADREPSIGAMTRDARHQMDALNGQLRSAVDLAAYATPAGLTAFARKEARRPRRLRLRSTAATLRANLSLQSAAFRHAVRLAACVALGEALGRGFELRRPYWLPMTIAIVLKPDFTATFSRGALRLCGTFAGLACATEIFHMLPAGSGAEIALVALLMYVLRWVGAANYGVFVTAVTALVVALVSLTGVPPREVILARGINTAAGGAIALLAYWLWPT